MASKPDGPAAHAGLKIGDVILKFGKQVPRDARALARMIAATAVGEPASVLDLARPQGADRSRRQWPNGRTSSRRQASAAAKSVQAVHIDLPDLGLQTAAITAETRAKYKLDQVQMGVVITGVARGSAGDESGLAAGVVILRVQQAPVATTEDLLARFSDARTAKRHHVVLLIQDHNGLRWIPLFVD